MTISHRPCTIPINITYPGLRAGANAGVNDGRSTGSRVSLGVEAQVGAEELNTLVISWLDHPLLVGRSRLVAVGAVTGGQSDGSTIARIGYLERRASGKHCVEVRGQLTLKHCPPWASW
jgi:hypothetical protein